MNRFVLAAMIGLWVTVAACGQNEPAKPPAGPAQQKDEYREKVKMQLDELAERIAALKPKVEQAGDEARAKMGEIIARLEEKKERAEEKLEELKTTAAEKWEGLKADIDARIEDLKRSYDRAVERSESG